MSQIPYKFVKNWSVSEKGETFFFKILWDRIWDEFFFVSIRFISKFVAKWWFVYFMISPLFEIKFCLKKYFSFSFSILFCWKFWNKIIHLKIGYGQIFTSKYVDDFHIDLITCFDTDVGCCFVSNFDIIVFHCKFYR